MLKLIICEKPSTAKSITSALGVTYRVDSYFEGNGYPVFCCIGHLVGLADAAAYDDRYKKWRYEDLPILIAPSVMWCPRKRSPNSMFCNR